MSIQNHYDVVCFWRDDVAIDTEQWLRLEQSRAFEVHVGKRIQHSGRLGSIGQLGRLVFSNDVESIGRLVVVNLPSMGSIPNTWCGPRVTGLESIFWNGRSSAKQPSHL